MLVRVPQRQEALEPQLEEPLPQEDQDLGGRLDAQLRGEPQLHGVLAHQPVAEGVEGGEGRPDEPVGHEQVHPRLHLGGRLVGEGEAEDLLRAGPLGGDEPGDAAGDDLGLARARARHDQERALAVGDGFELLRIEALEDRLDPRRGGGPGAASALTARDGRKERRESRPDASTLPSGRAKAARRDASVRGPGWLGSPGDMRSELSPQRLLQRSSVASKIMVRSHHV